MSRDALAPQTLLERMAWHDLRGARMTVVGLGRSGLACANELAARGADVLLHDDAPRERLAARLDALDDRVEVSCGQPFVGRAGDLVVISPGLPPHSATFRRARSLGSGLLSEVELFLRLDRAQPGGHDRPLVAITGTDGKTTTTLWTAALLEAAGMEVVVGGNIGTPLVELLGGLGPRAVLVAEISAFQLHTTHSLRPRASVLTNVAEDHLDWFGGDFAAYAATKRALARHQGAGDTVIYKAGDPALLGAVPATARGVPFGLDGDAVGDAPDALWLDGTTMRLRQSGGQPVSLGDARAIGADGDRLVLGRHNIANALAAAGAALAMGAGVQAIRAGLRGLQTPPHRLEDVGLVAGVRFVNDSKATNPHAAASGVASLPADEPLVWIGGGSEKDSDFGQIADIVAARAQAAVLIGATADRLDAALAGRLPVRRAADLPSAVAQAWQDAGGRGIVLLSPACASFDMFSGYAERGDVFRDAVRALRSAVQADL